MVKANNDHPFEFSKNRRNLDKDHEVARLTIPLEITITIVQPNPTTMIVVPDELAERGIKISHIDRMGPDSNYSRRKGYDPDFLPNNKVPLPRLAPDELTVAAKNTDGGGHELKYEHFSVVMNGERQIPFFAAANINCGNIAESWETNIIDGKEMWYADPRIGLNHQWNNVSYESQEHLGYIRGQLINPYCTNWGTEEERSRANADTYHFTNTVPQDAEFYDLAEWWCDFEIFLLEKCETDHQRLSVFVGPMLENVPKARDQKSSAPDVFWKIVARIEKGKLVATALLADQSSLKTSREVEQYQVSIKEIENITRLNFGPLRDHDTFIHQEGFRPKAKLIRGFTDIEFRAA